MNRTTSDGRTIVNTPDAPAAIGPYSQAIIAGGFVHCSGQVALDPKTMQIVAGDGRGEDAAEERGRRDRLPGDHLRCFWRSP